MKLEFAFFADAATTDSGGKLNVLGIFNNVNAHAYPCTHPRMCFVAKISSHRSEYGKHDLTITIVDEDGQDVHKQIQGLVEFHSQAPDAQIIMDFNHFTIPRPGVYSVDIAVDKHYLGSSIFKAVKL